MGRKARAMNPRYWVYIYSPHVAVDQAVTMSEGMFGDGKRRVILNPKHQAEIDAFLAAQDDV